MILVMLQLKSEFLRVDWTTPSQVSTLEPLLGTLLGSPWCPPNHISLSFPIWDSYAWFMNQRIHIFSMKMSWYYVVLGASKVCSWFLTSWVGEERSDSWLKLSQLSVTSPSVLCHLRNDGISACRERIHPLVDTCLFSDLIRQIVTWWERAPGVSVVAEIWLTSSCVLRLLRFVCGLAWPS